MSEIEIRLPPKLIAVFQGRADVRAAYGGRGSAKTRSFAKMAAFYGMRFGQAGVTGQVVCGRQFMNSLEDSSLEEVKRAIEDEPSLSAYYEVGERFIRSRDGRIWFTFVGLDRNIESIKSRGRILLLWVDEAEPVLESSWAVVVPTLREEGEDWNAELWVTWNPKRKTAAVDKRYRNNADPLVKVVQLNYRDNPKFPDKLERERQRDLKERPDQYDHIWEGGYVTVIEGAYYAKSLAVAKQEHRIGALAADPLLTVRAYCDIGGTGAKSDAFTIWIIQFVGMQIRTLDYYESVGQPIDAHAKWLRDRSYTCERTTIVLPHDGKTGDKVYKVSYQSAFEAMGYTVKVIPNMGAGAASLRIEAARRVFPQVWFNESTTEGGRDALGWYHEKKDDQRGIGLGPEHDWASHGADSFGMMAVDYEQDPPGNSIRFSAEQFASEFA